MVGTRYLCVGVVAATLSGAVLGGLDAQTLTTDDATPVDDTNAEAPGQAEGAGPAPTADPIIVPLPQGEYVEILPPAADDVTAAMALEAWARIYEVASHPRCANCHVGADNIPMWSGPSYGRPRPHGMNIVAGPSRIGGDPGHIPCSTCHGYSESGGVAGPRMAPQVAGAWRLAPVEAAWFGQSSAEICQQLRDPARNGGRDYLDLAVHLDHDVILHWAWSPGPGREPAPYSLQAHVNDILLWGVGGMPCPDE